MPANAINNAGSAAGCIIGQAPCNHDALARRPTKTGLAAHKKPSRQATTCANRIPRSPFTAGPLHRAPKPPRSSPTQVSPCRSLLTITLVSALLLPSTLPRLLTHSERPHSLLLLPLEIKG